MTDRDIWFKGQLISANDAKVSAFSPMAQYGLNVFEGIRGYWNEREGQLFLFRLADHFARLLNSCKLMGISCPYTIGEVQEFLLETIKHGKYQCDLSVRIIVFIDGEGSWRSSQPADLLIAPIKNTRSDTKSLKGLSACISTWTRIGDNCMPPRIKAGANYINGRYGHLEARRNGYDVPIFLGANGKVSEGAGTCLFIVRDGVLITTTVTSSVLESITRATLLELAGSEKVEVLEREIDRTELYFADEVFLCGSSSEVTPITSVDRMPVGNGDPGPVTTALLRRYIDVVSNEEQDVRNWLTPVYQR